MELLAPESLEMHGTVSIFMVLEVGGKLAAGLRIIRNAWDCYHFQSFRSASNTWNNYHLHRTVIIFIVLEVPRTHEIIIICIEL